MRLLLLLLLALPCSAHWLARPAAVGVCVAGALDLISTHSALERGAREANPIFGDHGRERWAPAISFKAAVCATSSYLGWRYPRSRALAITNAGLAAGWTALAIHNFRWRKP